jgi:excinuclease ABC subunit A
MPKDPSNPRDTDDAILIHGARQNNLKNLDVRIPLNELVVVTGVSGSGKSSLVFDTLYAEGQRRYVETFSPYARQFLDRQDRPLVDRIDGIPPAIAIDQTNPVRTSRSTVGTMTELNDHVKLLYARAAHLFCRGCAQPVKKDSPESICDELLARASKAADPRLQITFPVAIPKTFKAEEVEQLLAAQGYTRFHSKSKTQLEVVQDRFRASSAERTRVIEALEAALRVGQGKVNVYASDADPQADGTPAPGVVWRFSSDFHCPDCDIHYGDPTPSLFSFNSPVGACEVCRGFGRVIGIDFGLIVPDASKTLREGAVRPWQTPSFKECQDDLVKCATKAGIPLDTPWRQLTEAQRHWVLEGEPGWVSWKKSWPGTWYGVRIFFAWLESKSYKMHIRVLLSKYRAYTPCTACDGARLKPDALLWRLGTKEDADRALGNAIPPHASGVSAPFDKGVRVRFRPKHVTFSDAQLAALPGLTVHDLMLLPIERVRALMDSLHLPAPLDEATDLLLTEIRARLKYLCDVGLPYLTLDRQSRTLSGGEVQRINLTTALGTSLVNTLFVLDEPSIGLHPRDMGRVIGVMHRLRDAGNSLVVVEHDPQIMFEADRILDMGPGPGERGGEVVFYGTPDELRAAQTLTGDYLSGRKKASHALSSLALNDKARALRLRNTGKLELLGATHNNLKNIDLSIPLGRLVCITGVSGSGKSTLMQDVLYAALCRAKGKPTENPGAHRALRGHELISEVVMVDQTPIGRTTRSNPASYVGAWDAIRNLFARTPKAKEREYTSGTFSFNSGNGRCPTCGGNGFEHIEMQFLSDVYLRCPDCDGRRFRAEVLEIKLRGVSIADVLEMTVSEAIHFFSLPGEAEVARVLKPLADVGLEYLKVGQPVPTLSGGEAQRLKLAGHLAEAAHPTVNTAGKTKLFLFDEPTTGLHFDDVAKLLRAFGQLLDAGHSLVVIEHNLDVIAASEWIVDLGPEGGDGGGEIVAEGTPDDIMKSQLSHTGAALREYRFAMEGLPPHAAVAAAVALTPAGYPPATARPLRTGNDAAAMVMASEAALMLSGFEADEQTPRRQRSQFVRIHNAREHNLKSIDVEIPRDRFTVITGVSGSGKSTLAFDILFAEGQRRYLESLNAYARQFVQSAARPDVDAIFGIPPTVAIEQRTSRGGSKSTVATLTEVYHFLRLLYVKLGTQYCPDCDVPIEPQSFDAIAARIARDYRGQRIGLLAPLVINRKGFYTDLAKWAKGKGYEFLRVDGEFLPTAKWPRLDRFKEHSIELPVADLVIAPENEAALRAALVTALDHGKGIVYVLGKLDKLANLFALQGAAGKERVEIDLPLQVFSTKRACPSCARSFAELDPRLFSFNSKHGWCGGCFGTGLKLSGFEWDEEREKTGDQAHVLDSWVEWLEIKETCPSCDGKRLNPEALAVRWQGSSIAELTKQPIARVEKVFSSIALEGRAAAIAQDSIAELKSRLGFLEQVGLGYLSLDRSAPTLSGGEAQRIRLAAQLGSNLRGVCYILDEPTIGLHPRDNAILLDKLEALERKGNTLVVVEHDEDTIRRAAHVIDLGPGAGKLGGRVIGSGTAAELMANPESLTGKFLKHPLLHPLHPPRAVALRGNAQTATIDIEAADLHNLRKVNARIPLGRLTVVTGVSGSGKSTLARDVLHANLSRLVSEVRRRTPGPVIGCKSITGWDPVGRVLEVDQTPIGKTPRSCPATYVGFYDAIRRLYAEANESRMRGWTASRFSFNTKGGRCEECEGQGIKKIEMSFLPDVRVLCEACRGARFNPETLSIKWRGKSIGDVLAMSVDEAVEFFAAHTSIHHALRLLQDVGLGYLTLGQQSPTLSGGEAQRIKLVTELSKVRLDAAGNAAARPGRGGAQQSTLYVLDEPTVGLHMADVEKLIRVLHRLVDAGNTVVVIEHNLDVMADADWIIDMGPEGGDAGGTIVAQGSPQELAAKPERSHTSRVLGEFLGGRSA